MLSTVRKGPPTRGAGNETTDPDDDSGHQRCSGRPLDAITPLVRRHGTVPDDQQLSGDRPNGSQRKSERRIRHAEGAEIPGTDGPGDEQGEQEVGRARKQLVRKGPAEPPDHAATVGCRLDGRDVPGRPAGVDRAVALE